MTGRLDTDVIVVGAGPVGLVLTGELRLNGVRAITLERLPEPTGESRASILHARTMSLFAERGVLDWLGPVPEGGPGHFGGIRLDLAAAAPGHPFAGQWECPQARLEVVLGEWVADLGADVRRGHLVTGLRQHPDRVEVDVRTPDADGIRRLSAAYVVGCDGEDSTVRRLAGIDLAGAGATRQMLRADVVGIDIPNRRLQRLPNGVATAYRRADGTTRLMVHRYGRPPRTGQPAPDFAEVVALWAEVTGEDIGHGVPRWVNRFDDACLQATRYRIGRVLLAGDAAHVQMPIGGTDEFSVTLAAKRIEEEVGRLDSLVNNAGIGGPPLPPSQTPIEQVRRTFETNVFGVITVTNTMMPLLRRSAAGRIVNVSSLLGSLRHAADRTDPTGVFPPGVFPAVLDYNTSKAALNAITVTYANELRDTGILVNAVSPGFVATDINDHRGVLTPEQGARIPVLLATLGDDGPTAAFLTEDGTPTGRRLEW